MTMDTTIEQQADMDEALVPHAQRLRIGRSNFRLLSNIKSKESTLQLVYDAIATVYHHAIQFTMDNKKHIVKLESFRDMLYICPRVHGQSFDEPPFEEEILAFIRFLGHSAAIRTLTDFGALLPIELTNEEIRNSNAYKEYYAIDIGAAPPKPKASVRRTQSSSDTSITPPTAAACPRLTSSQKGKQAAKASKAKNEGTGSIPGVPDVPTDESEEELSWNSTDDEGDADEGNDGDDDEKDEGDNGEEGDGDDDDKDDDGEEETRDEESFDPIPQTLKNSDDEGNGEEDLGLNVGGEEGHVEEDEENKLYRDVNINQRRGI
nr:hypothetical protein [Tanacetum cinerariifolium]